MQISANSILIIATMHLLVCDNLWAISEKTNKTTHTTGIITNDTNLHYTGEYCLECHEKTPVKGTQRLLKYDGDFKLLCRCHNNTPGSYIHPVDIVPSKDKKARIPSDFPLTAGKIACITCHDIFAQCQKRVIDKMSLRGAPYPKRTEFCFKCHNKQNFMRLDVHNQLDKNRQIVVDKCLYCHVKKPDEKQETYKDLNFISDLGALCRRCHLIRGNHSGNFNHMVKPSVKGLAKMRRIEKKFGIILPLEADGKMTCITCHNPHDKGVIPVERASAKGAGSKFRHRLPGKLCVECHQM